MIRSYRQIIGQKIAGYDHGQALALMWDMIIHPDTGKIEAFWVKPLTVYAREAVVLAGSILEWKKNVYIKDEREIAEAGDILRIGDILTRDIPFIGNRVKSESGEYLGKVYDLDFDTQHFTLRNLYVCKSFLGFKYSFRMFPWGAVIETFSDHILVKNTEKKELREAGPIILPGKQPILDV